VTFLRVALTGGIATGKSWVLTRFAFHQVPTIDADVIAHDVARAGQPASTDIRQRFGDDVFRSDGELDRQELGARVFDDPDERKALEAIIHPHVRAAIDRWFSEVETEGQALFAVADIPLLFETSRQEEFDIVVVTACPPSLQLERIVARDHLSAIEASQRITIQLPTERRLGAADFEVRTDMSDADTDRQVDEIYEALSGQARGDGTEGL